jgi:hypothetical protein
MEALSVIHGRDIPEMTLFVMNGKPSGNAERNKRKNSMTSLARRKDRESRIRSSKKASWSHSAGLPSRWEGMTHALAEAGKNTKSAV